MNTNNLVYNLWKLEPEYLNKLGLPKNITIGVEIEFANAFLLDIYKEIQRLGLDSWITKKDNSITFYIDENRKLPIGGEVTSPILKDNKKSWKQLGLICNALRQVGATTNEETGAHVHIGANILNKNKEWVLNLVKLWITYENIIYQAGFGVSGKLRPVAENYAKKIANIIKFNFDRLENSPTYEILIMNLNDYFKFKEYGLDFTHVKEFSYMDKLDTVEFRSANGTLDEKFWQHLICMYSHMMMYASSDNFDDEFVTYRLNHNYMRDWTNALEFSNLIFTEEIDKLRFLKNCFNINSEKEAQTLIRKIERK